MQRRRHLLNLAELAEGSVKVCISGLIVEAEDPDTVGWLWVLPVPLRLDSLSKDMFWWLFFT